MKELVRLFVAFSFLPFGYCEVDSNHTSWTDENRTLRDKVVGGTTVRRGTYPWFARGTTNDHQGWSGCGGSLVSPQFVLTAAHCIQGRWRSDSGYEIGALCPEEGDNCGQYSERILGTRAYVHPSFKSSTLSHDFAMIKLDEASSIDPVSWDNNRLSWKYSRGRNTKMLWTAGLGRTSFNGQLPDPFELQEVEVEYETLDNCKRQYSSYGEVNWSMLCAASANKDACQGDSGGPLYDKDNRKLVGVVSWGNKCAATDYPGVYSRIAVAREWMEFIICTKSNKFSLDPLCRMCGRNEERIDIMIQPGGSDFSWEILNSSTNRVEKSEVALNGKKARYYKLCVSKGDSYSFTRRNSAGDGMAGGKSALFVDGNVVRDANASFSAEYTTTF